MLVGAGKACTASTLPGSRVDSIGIIEAAKEVDGLGLHMCFLWVEHQVIFVGDMHKVS